MDEHRKRRYNSPDAQEVAEIFETLSTKIPDMINGILGSLFSPEAASNMGKAVVEFRKSLIEARAYHQNEVFDAAVTFAKTEGIIPAPETAHAIKATVDEALEVKKTGEEKVILFNLSGHGHFDLAAYDTYHRGELADYDLPDDKIKAALKDLEGLPKAE